MSPAAQQCIGPGFNTSRALLQSLLGLGCKPNFSQDFLLEPFWRVLPYHKAGVSHFLGGHNRLLELWVGMGDSQKVRLSSLPQACLLSPCNSPFFPHFKSIFEETLFLETILTQFISLFGTRPVAKLFVDEFFEKFRPTICIFLWIRMLPKLQIWF